MGEGEETEEKNERKRINTEEGQRSRNVRQTERRNKMEKDKKEKIRT